MRLHLLELYWVVPMCRIQVSLVLIYLGLKLLRMYQTFVISLANLCDCWCSGALLRVVPETMLQMSVPRQWSGHSLFPLCHCETVIMRGSRGVPILQQRKMWVCLGFISPTPRTLSDNVQISFSSLSSFLITVPR